MPNWCTNDLVIYNTDKVEFLMLTLYFQQEGLSFQKINPLDPSKPWHEEFPMKWSCKWNISEEEGNYDNMHVTSRSIRVCFDTPWGPPSNAILELSRKFPKLKMKLCGYERGMGFQTKEIMLAGQKLVDEEKKYYGDRGG